MESGSRGRRGRPPRRKLEEVPETPRKLTGKRGRPPRRTPNEVQTPRSKGRKVVFDDEDDEEYDEA